MMRKVLAIGGTAFLIASLGATPPPRAEAACTGKPNAAYVGSKSCLKCHFKEYRDWQKTAMAKAFDLLKAGTKTEEKKTAGLDPAKDYTRDTTCLKCHTTGYGEPGGYPALVEGKAWSAEDKMRAAVMEGIGCESCHGPGSITNDYKKDNKNYLWKDLVSRGAVHPDEKNCLTCHNSKSPTYREFKYTDKVGKDSHGFQKMKQDHSCDHAHR